MPVFRIGIPVSLLLLLSVFPAMAYAGEQQRNSEQVASLVIVNGKEISRDLLDEFARLLIGQPNPYDETTPEEPKERLRLLNGLDRVRLLDELVTMEAMAQVAVDRGLHRHPSLVAEAELSYKTLLQRQLVRELLDAIRVSQAELRQRYDLLQPERQYNISDIVFDKQDDAVAAIQQIGHGTSFARLAQKRKVSGIWQMPSQLDGAVATAVAALTPGKHTTVPVHDESGWHVIRLNDVRNMAKPPLEQVRGGLRMQLLQEKLQAEIQAIKGKAVIDFLRVPDNWNGTRR